MEIALVCDILMKKELNCCDIATEISIGLKTNLTITNFCESTDINFDQYDLILLWTHEGDKKDYSSIISAHKKCKRFIHMHFEKNVVHDEIRCTSTFTRANYQLHICFPYYAYSQYWKPLRQQIRKLLKHELMKKQL